MGKIGKILLITLLVVLIGLGGVLYYVVSAQKGDEPPTAEELAEMTIEVPEITANLKDRTYVMCAVNITTDSKESKEELELLLYKVNDVLIKELADMTAEQLTGKKNIAKFQETIKKEASDILTEGKISEVYITKMVTQ